VCEAKRQKIRVEFLPEFEACVCRCHDEQDPEEVEDEDDS